MKRFVTSILSLLLIAVILGADAGHPLALRFEGAVAIWVAVVNTLAALCCLLIFSKDAVEKIQSSWAKRGALEKAYMTLNGLVWLAVLAYVGWLWSFGIRAVTWFLFEAVQTAPEKDAN